MDKVKVRCDWCGLVFDKYVKKVTPHNFCSRACHGAFSSKTRNPREYASLKDYTGQSMNMSEINRRLNPTRHLDKSSRVKEPPRIPKKREGKRDAYVTRHGLLEHRVMAERILGRQLREGEVVHHINRDKQDNRLENLMIFSSASEHAKWHKEHDKEVMPDEV